MSTYSGINSLGRFWKYARFTLPFVLGWAAVYAIIVGPSVSAMGLIIGLFVVLTVEWFSGEGLDVPEYHHPSVLVWLMRTYLFIVLAAFAGFAWTFAHRWNGGDLFGLAAGIQSLTGFDMFAAHAGDGIGTYILTTLLFSALIGIGSLSVGHENIGCPFSSLGPVPRSVPSPTTPSSIRSAITCRWARTAIPALRCAVRA